MWQTCTNLASKNVHEDGVDMEREVEHEPLDPERFYNLLYGEENRAAYDEPRYQNLQNLNLMPSVADMVGGKVGLSSSAGDSMLGVFEIEIDGQKRPIAIIVLGASDAKDGIETLLEYTKRNFSPTISFTN